MAAFDNVQLPKPPAAPNYAAPLVGFTLGQDIASLPDQYFQGTQRARTLAMQQPVVDPNTGQPTTDPRAIMGAAMQRGGLESAVQLLPQMQKQQFLDYLKAQQPPTQADQPSPSQPAPVQNTTAGPANIRPQTKANQPGEISMAGDGTQADPYRPKSMADFQDIEAGSYFVTPGGKIVVKGQQAAPQTPPVQVAQGGLPAAGPPAAGQTTGAVGSPAGLPPGGAPGAPAFPTGPGPGGLPSPASVTIPSGYRGRELEYVQQQDQIADQIDSRAQQAEVLGYKADAMRAQATAARARAQAVREEMAKRGQAQLESGLRAGEPTPTQKDVASGADLSKAVNEQQAKRSSEVYSGIQGAANQFETGLKPYLDLSRSILNDPRVYTGAGGNLSLDINRVKSFLGDQNAAVLQEALTKVTAASVLAQINETKNQLMQAGGPGSSGRIFQQQVALVEKAAPQLSTTGAGNRFLVEVASRMGDLSTTVRDMAADYLQSHKTLDTGFDKTVASYLKAHPIFNRDELSNPALLGAPAAPPNVRTPQQAAAWASGMQLRRGDPIRVNGQYRYYQGGQ